MSRSSLHAWNMAVRIALLGLACLFVLAGPLPLWMARLVPGLSPLAFLAETIAQRRWGNGLYWALPPLFFLVMAAWRGRFFCRWICPLGAAYYLLSPRRPTRRLLDKRLHGVIFWMIVGSSILGLPALLPLDPQSTLQRFLTAFRLPLNVALLIPALLFPVFLLLGFFQPMIWCSHLCPTGYLFELIRGLARAPRATFNAERRALVGGLLAGMPIAALSASLPHGWRAPDTPTLLPPGALPPPDFGATCHRCYTCVAVCPTGILRVDFRPDRSLIEWFQPEMNPLYGGCQKDCNRCGLACPTGAIRPLTLPEKQRARIGLARVVPSLCLAWEHGQECLKCAGACPYDAIASSPSRTGVLAPVVIAERCTGCGYCQSVCPCGGEKAIRCDEVRGDRA